MNIELHAHQDFYRATRTLAEQFAVIQNEVKAAEQEVRGDCEALIKAVRQAGANLPQGPLQNSLAAYFAEADAVLDAWQKKVEHYDAGLELRARFDDSLLIFVYGKVKAGKSSLGNYLACGRTQPDAQWLESAATELPKPDFFAHEINEAAGEQINHRTGFGVGATETTSCIQGFTMPGFTWVDSPGLHSVNSANGELAKKYVESADLILYLMNSAQPGRASDLAELEALLKQGKRILVLITRCDLVEEDEVTDANGEPMIVEVCKMKTAKDRADQENHVRKELSELCEKLDIRNADVEVLSISTGYAESEGNHSSALAESGLQAFFAKLTDVLASEGIQLKQETPRRNLQAFYAQFADESSELSFGRLRPAIHNALAEVNTLEDELAQLREQAQPRIENEFIARVDELVSSHAHSRDLKKLSQQLQQVLESAIARHYQQPLQHKLERAQNILATISQDMGLCMGLSFEDRHERIWVDNSGKRAAIGSGLGTLVGAGIGFFFGGPVGAAIGAGVGATGGGLTGKALADGEFHSAIVGDNREDLKDALIGRGLEHSKRILSDGHQREQRLLITPIRAALSSLSSQIDLFEHKIAEKNHA